MVNSRWLTWRDLQPILEQYSAAVIHHFQFCFREVVKFHSLFSGSGLHKSDFKRKQINKTNHIVDYFYLTVLYSVFYNL